MKIYKKKKTMRNMENNKTEKKIIILSLSTIVYIFINN